MSCVPFGCRFTSDVKIKSISVVGGVEGTSPSRMRALVLELQIFLSWILTHPVLSISPNHNGMKFMKSTLTCYRFINREGIDFSDAQNMQPVQVRIHFASFHFRTKRRNPPVIIWDVLVVLGMGTGREFAGSSWVPNKVFLIIICSACACWCC